MKGMIIGLLAGNVASGLLLDDWSSVVTMTLGQASAIVPLWYFGYLREKNG